MKIKKIFAIFATLFVMSASAFAEFDGSTFWKEYGGPLKDGDGVFNVGLGLTGDIFKSNQKFFIPAIETSYEKMVHINDMLPFSFGGYSNFSGSFCEVYDIKYNYMWINAGALVKYHFNFGIENFDVYAGTKLGLDIYIDSIDDKYTTSAGLDINELIGCTYWFSEKFGLTAETGYPAWLNIRCSFRF